MRGRALIALLLALAFCVSLSGFAQADGDPGSDVLLNQNLFAYWDANLSTAQQLQLGRLLDATARAGAPVRVALIAHSDDLGTVTTLWEKPQTYASYLGYELSSTYDGRLLVVMPGGVGVYWHNDPAGATRLASELSALRPGSSSPKVLAAATDAAVYRIEAAAGVERSALTGSGGGGASSSARGAGHSQPEVTAGHSTRQSAARHHAPAGWLLALLILSPLLYVVWRSGRLRRLWTRLGSMRPRRELKRLRITSVALLPAALLAIVVAALVINHSNSESVSSASAAALALNPHIDPGTPVNSSERAPNFTLTSQTGRRISLSQYRGKVVLLAFVDAECQTICPLTTQAMLDAKAALGSAGSRVQLLGVNANWKSTQVEDVLTYTQLHGLTGRWQFLTGTERQLQRVWKHYGVDEKAFVAKNDNEIDHVAAMYLIDPQGRRREVFTTYPSYASIPQVGQLLAHDISRLLPDHPQVSSNESYEEIHGTPPTQRITLSRLGGASVRLGPGKPHLYLFFDTWDRGTTRIGYELDQLNVYQRDARAHGLPELTAIDEGSVEPSPVALPEFVSTLQRPLSYPVAIDGNGRVADGYGVEGEPWFVLTDSAGKIVWFQEVYTEGFPETIARLEQEVKASLAAPGSGGQTRASAALSLSGSPAPLAKLHRQASTVVSGGESALDARIRSLHGYPVVLNIWASWCGPCQREFGEFAQASATYGRRVAFLGADNGDSVADAEAFMRQHHVIYPSYETRTDQLDNILVGGLEGTPTTVFIRPDGSVAAVRDQPYDSLGALESDIRAYALSRGG
jgi:cytochrome oxidase Cu insertion factor (SCO1/SenC/PrrC family)/thiol-disulfide isomerase/thioredoxin